MAHGSCDSGTLRTSGYLQSSRRIIDRILNASSKFGLLLALLRQQPTAALALFVAIFAVRGRVSNRRDGDISDGTEFTTVVQVFVLQTEEVPDESTEEFKGRRQGGQKVSVNGSDVIE